MLGMLDQRDGPDGVEIGPYGTTDYRVGGTWYGVLSVSFLSAIAITLMVPWIPVDTLVLRR